MATFAEASAALDLYRAALLEGQLNEGVAPEAFASRGKASFTKAAPLNNVHATGVGLRIRDGKISGKSIVIKVYVFDKRDLGTLRPTLTGKTFQGVQIDIEKLPVQKPRPTTPAQHQARHRPLLGGIQIAPRGVDYVGTLGGIVRSGDRYFILSNNHVLADTNQIPLGRRINQPIAAGTSTGVARLTDYEPIRFPSHGTTPRNRMDAAIAELESTTLTTVPGQMFGIPGYRPSIIVPRPNMLVTKSGRTTAVTRGRIIATRVDGVRVDYGQAGIATFDQCVQIRGASGSFSTKGDSGSFIIDEETGHAAALLFAGDNTNTFACDMTAVCARFQVVPV